MSWMEVSFFICLFFTLYPYLVYPLLIIGCSRVGGRMWLRGEDEPIISLVISVYNEAEVIREKIENALSLDYPKERFEIVVVSDGSTDGTGEIVDSFADERIVLLAYPERAGKTACLNRAVPVVKGEIVVFTDANSIFPGHALKKIARNFSDESIGLVTGWTKYRRSGSEEEEAPGLYARLEKITKEGESLISSCVGADGAIFAIRKELYTRLEEYDINDFVIPLNVIGQKKRAVLDPEVYCLEEPSEGAAKEFRRQARITNRTLGAIWRNLRFLNHFTYGSFAFFLASHKILRFMVPFFACGMLFTSLFLMPVADFYTWTFLSLIFFIFAGTTGLLNLLNSKLIRLSAMFLLTNFAQMVGWFRFATGRSDTMWTPRSG